jgi:aspartate/methionine/tyrosine aminotransferase
MHAMDFDLLDWLNDRETVVHNLGSSCLTFLKLTDIPGFELDSFDFLMDCGTDMGDQSLISCIADQYGLGPENVAITSSASEGNFLVESLFSEGTIAVESPCYEPLLKLTSVLGAKTRSIPRPFGNRFRFNPEVLKEQVAGCQLLVMTNLHNPSGVGLSSNELREVIEICEDAGTMVLVDEIFRHFSDGPSAVEFGENVVINASPSKFFGACGLRIGHLVGNRKLIGDIERLKMLITPNASVISQRVYLLIMRNLNWFIERGRKIMGPNTDYLRTWIDGRGDVEWIPSEGNIAFPRIFDPGTGTSPDTMKLGTQLKQEQGLMVTPGKYFGPEGEGHIRIGFGIPNDNLKMGLEALRKGLDEWWAKR